MEPEAFAIGPIALFSIAQDSIVLHSIVQDSHCIALCIDQDSHCITLYNTRLSFQEKHKFVIGCIAPCKEKYYILLHPIIHVQDSHCTVHNSTRLALHCIAQDLHGSALYRTRLALQCIESYTLHGTQAKHSSQLVPLQSALNKTLSNNTRMYPIALKCITRQHTWPMVTDC